MSAGSVIELLASEKFFAYTSEELKLTFDSFFTRKEMHLKKSGPAREVRLCLVTYIF